MIIQAVHTGDHVNIFLGGVIGMIVLALSLIAFFVVYQRKIFEQERGRDEERRAYQRSLLAAAVEVQEAERQRIARDLHDDIGSLLTATRLYLRQLKPASTTEQVVGIRDQSLSILDEMIQNARRITHDLLPPTLEKFGFQAAAEDLCERIDGGGELAVIFQDTSPEGLRLSGEAEIGLYRVLQELLTNTLKHAGARTVRVSLGADSRSFTLHYADDGKGVDLQPGPRSGLGLRNVESRVSLLAGTLVTETSPGEGMRVEVSVPLGKPPSEE
ncbi:sensor histidine kinase [Neolewinella antarctica]|uniref:Signal transduction histidine kinase n=1 Tax=Neolewinella antarctica TaxID=442734 RepID=A0ABX0X7F3_9BACT|nr:sensor histidine kinase [Neolewinella antarctica]NJC24914.1 signal transduction histidine kinase [Neolewinella antarctica]